MTYLIVRLLDLVFTIFNILILIEVIGSWILVSRVRLPDWAYQILQLVHSLTAPVLNPIRRLIPAMGLDLSPIIALLLMNVLQNLLHQVLLR